MLSPEQIEAAGDAVAAVYGEIEAKMLDRLVAALLSGDGLGQADAAALNLLAQSHSAELLGILEEHRAEIDAAVLATAERYLEASDADDVARCGGSPAWPRQVRATVQGVARILARDNLQMVEGAKRAFLGASIEAVTRVNAGVSGPERAIHSAVRKLERDGIGIVTYQNRETGAVTVENRIDVAVRRHVRTQIAQDGMRMAEERMREMGVQLVEVSSHPDSRPGHRAWQGRCYSLAGDVEIDGTRYPDFYAATGYGSVDGLGGANCRHSFGPYRHGMPRAYEPDPKPACGLPGEEVYALEQGQRYRERKIREAKRELRGARLVYERDRGDASLAEYLKAKQKLRDRQEKMRAYIDSANARGKVPGAKVLHRHPAREWAGDMPKGKVPIRTKHGDERMRERGVTDEQAADAIINPLEKFPVVTDDRGRKSQKHVGRSATVALNPDTNEIITAYKTGKRTRRRYGID